MLKNYVLKRNFHILSENGELAMKPHQVWYTARIDELFVAEM